MDTQAVDPAYIVAYRDTDGEGGHGLPVEEVRRVVHDVTPDDCVVLHAVAEEAPRD